jgi:hypothetical protein
MKKVRDQIDELYAVHCLCMNINHGIQFSNRQWKLFIPSSFVYSFFTFNTIYSFDWFKTCELEQPVSWDSDNASCKEPKPPSEPKKFRKYIDFLYKRLGENLPGFFYKHLIDSIGSINDPCKELEYIILDKRIDKTVSESFQKHFSLVWNKKVEGKKHKKSLKEIAYFVYLVRNNIFHGEKNTMKMMDDKQQVRLRIYAGILSSLNQLLFVAAERSLGWAIPNVEIGRQRINETVKWDRVFIWSGFEFKKEGSAYNFQSEKDANREYLSKILNEIGHGTYFDGNSFQPEVSNVNRSDWIDAVEKLHSGAEGGSFDELPIMDPYIGGIVRSINKLGFNTNLSCDGHGVRNNRITLTNRRKSYALDACIRVISKGKYGFENSSVVKTKRPMKKMGRQEEIDRRFLLDIAELLHKNTRLLEKLLNDIGGEELIRPVIQT